jgi:hypothetical protein
VFTISNPVSGKWSLVINAGVVSDATGVLSIKALKVVPVAYDGGTFAVTGQAPATKQFFSVTVPAGASGWDIRLRNVVGPMPSMYVRRDLVPGPPSQISPGWQYWTFKRLG